MRRLTTIILLLGVWVQLPAQTTIDPSVFYATNVEELREDLQNAAWFNRSHQYSFEGIYPEQAAYFRGRADAYETAVTYLNAILATHANLPLADMSPRKRTITISSGPAVVPAPTIKSRPINDQNSRRKPVRRTP